MGHAPVPDAFVHIVEVGRRDGLQNEPVILSPAQRAALITDLAAAMLDIEGFSHGAAAPHLAAAATRARALLKAAPPLPADTTAHHRAQRGPTPASSRPQGVTP